MSIRKLIQLGFLVTFLSVSFVASSPLYSIICCGIGVIFLLNILQQPCPISEKIFFMILHVILFIIQLAAYDTLNRSFYNQVITTVLLFLSFFIGMYFNTRIENIKFNKFDEKNLSFCDFKLIKQDVINAINLLQISKKKVNVATIKEIMMDIPRHSSFEYINNNSLSDTYFDIANKSLEDPFVYIICSDTGSAASNVISLFTRKVYNHCSLSFDKELRTLISYNGGEKIYPPGLNAETIEWLFKKKESSVLIYRLHVTKQQKQIMLNKVKQINIEGSAYNLLGLVTGASFRPNILYCSQFVYSILESANALYFHKGKNKLRPTDFIERDYERKLEFVEKICL